MMFIFIFQYRCTEIVRSVLIYFTIHSNWIFWIFCLDLLQFRYTLANVTFYIKKMRSARSSLMATPLSQGNHQAKYSRVYNESLANIEKSFAFNPEEIFSNRINRWLNHQFHVRLLDQGALSWYLIGAVAHLSSGVFVYRNNREPIPNNLYLFLVCGSGQLLLFKFELLLFNLISLWKECFLSAIFQCYSQLSNLWCNYQYSNSTRCQRIHKEYHRSLPLSRRSKSCSFWTWTM